MKWLRAIAYCTSFLLIISSCQQETATPLALTYPGTFVPPLIPSDNPLTVQGVALGKALFFDPILSLDSTISCATCHRPELAFTDGGGVSKGFAGRKGLRSAPTLLNVGFHYKGLFWDGRSPSLEEQALHPISDSVEMAGDWVLVEQRLRDHQQYISQFKQAFGEVTIDRYLVAKALAQYQRTLISSDSKYDQVMNKEAVFTALEQRGFDIFFDARAGEVSMGECAHCHTDPLFTNLNYENNGLQYAPDLLSFADNGRGNVTGSRFDNGKFKVPTLRNIVLTAPYMHDGRMATLEEVLMHYNDGGHYAPNRDPQVRPLHLDDNDQQALISFLHTLTDSVALQHYQDIRRLQ